MVDPLKRAGTGCLPKLLLAVLALAVAIGILFALKSYASVVGLCKKQHGPQLIAYFFFVRSQEPSWSELQ